MSSQSSIRTEVQNLWATTDFGVKSLAYKYGLTEQSVRSIVTGIKGPPKVKHSLSAYHRAIGMLLIDKRVKLQLGKKEFARMCGVSHFRLRDLEKGQDEITITELILADLLQDVVTLDTALLENE